MLVRKIVRRYDVRLEFATHPHIPQSFAALTPLVHRFCWDRNVMPKYVVRYGAMRALGFTPYAEAIAMSEGLR